MLSRFGLEKEWVGAALTATTAGVIVASGKTGIRTADHETGTKVYYS
jgi:hypothetical protein